MKITILAIGKKHDPKIAEAIEGYTKRLNHYCPTSWKLVDVGITSSMSPEEIKRAETEVLLKSLSSEDKVVLLDEMGSQLTSTQNSEALQKHLNKSTKHLVFVIGGAYGVSEELKSRADFTWSLSSLVFPHQLVRLILIEQLYRGFTIINNEKYHHK